jgi:protocatechuate 3,4-dioxygenase beta subunit
MRMLRIGHAALVVPLLIAAASAQQPPSRDPGAVGANTPVGTASLAGTVVVAGSGQPARHARISISSTELRGSRSTTTDSQGRFEFVSLPAGRYSLNVTKPGHVNISYGQTRPGPGRPGTPIQLSEGQRFEARLQIPRGSVITGTILDEQGEAIPGTPVRVLRHVTQNGLRTLQQAGSGSTDDRGIYRVYGLQPGEYLVLATPRNQGPGAELDRLRTEIVALRERAAALSLEDAAQAKQLLERASLGQAQLPEGDESATGYAPVYYPGTTVAASAASMIVGAGEERTGIDFQLQLVPIARVEGIVVNSTDQPLQNTQIMLVPLGQNVPGVGTYSARADRDGKFTISGVAPGQYTVIARSAAGAAAMRMSAEMADPTTGRGAAPGGRGQGPGPLGGRGPGGRGAGPDVPRLWAMADLTVDGRNVSNLVLTLQTGMSVTGRIMFQGSAQIPTDLSRMRVSLAPMDFGTTPRELATPAQGRVEASGRFTIGSVAPGRYRLTASGAGNGWYLESAVVDGQDSLDFPIEVKPNQNVSNAIVTFTDRQAELSGTLTDSRGQPAPDYTLVVFPSDQRFWTPQSRRIQATRPATDGRFVFRTLPPGEYRLAPVVDPEPGSWYDPAFLQQLDSSALRVSIAEGEKRIQDIRISGLQ